MVGTLVVIMPHPTSIKPAACSKPHQHHTQQDTRGPLKDSLIKSQKAEDHQGLIPKKESKKNREPQDVLMMQ